MHRSTCQTGEQAQPAFFSPFSTTLHSDEGTPIINRDLGESSKRKLQADTGEGCHNLLSSLCLASLTFVAFFFPLSDFFPRCWYPIRSGQVWKGVVSSCDVMSSFMVMFYDQLCCPASSGQDNRESHIVRKKLCKLQASVAADQAIFINLWRQLYQTALLWNRLVFVKCTVLFGEFFLLSITDNSNFSILQLLGRKRSFPAFLTRDLQLTNLRTHATTLESFKGWSLHLQSSDPGRTTKFTDGAEMNFVLDSVFTSKPSAILTFGHSDSCFERKSGPLHQSVLSFRRVALHENINQRDSL